MLSRNSDIVQVAPYDSAFAAAGNGGTAAGQTRLDTFTMGQKYRIRQNGTISRVKIYCATKTNLTGVYIVVWRRVGAWPLSTWVFNYIGESENIVASLTAGQLNTVNLSSPIANVREGDYYSITLITTGACAPLACRTAQTNVDMYYVVNTVPSATNYDWLSKTKLAGWALPVEMSMQAPHAIFIGDSIMGGYPAHGVYIDNRPLDGIEQTIANYLSAFTNYECVYQNMGYPGDTSTVVFARWAADVTAMHPRYVIDNSGVNDIGGAVAKATWLANKTAMLDACAAAGTIYIGLGIAPWTNGTNEQHVTRLDWNAALAALIGTYSTAVYVNLDPWVGQYRPTGPAGNLNNIKTAYNNDGVHFSGRGHHYIARGIATALNIPFYSTVTTSSPVRTQILTALAARLATITTANGYRTNVGSDVHEWQPDPLDPNESALRVEYRDEAGTTGYIAVREHLHTLPVTLRVVCKNNTAGAALSTVRDAITDIYQAIYTDVTFGGLAQDTNQEGQVKEDKGAAADTAAGAEVVYVIEYTTEAGSP